MLEWLRSREGWRPHVLNFAVGMVEEGLHDRAFTRDLDWGIPLPVDDLGPGKSIYVWWEAVMGYYSAPQEWAELQGDPEAWRAWWEDPEAETYYFVGKDNIPFHAVYWPALLMGHGGLNLPTDVPANQYVTFGGSKASKSRGVGRSLQWYIDTFEPDALRYAIAASFPETNDTDLSDDEMVRRVNDELVSTWGNLVNRVVSMTHRYFRRCGARGRRPHRGRHRTGRRHRRHAGRGRRADRRGEAAGRTGDGHGGCLRRERLPQRAGTLEDGEDRSRQDGYDPGGGARRHQRTRRGARAVSAVHVTNGSGDPGFEVPDAGPRWVREAVPAGTVLGPAVPLFRKAELPDDEE